MMLREDSEADVKELRKLGDEIIIIIIFIIAFGALYVLSNLVFPNWINHAKCFLQLSGIVA